MPICRSTPDMRPSRRDTRCEIVLTSPWTFQWNKRIANPAKRNPISCDVHAFSSCPMTTAGYRLPQFLTSLCRPTGCLPQSGPRPAVSGRPRNATATRSEATRLKVLSNQRTGAAAALAGNVPAYAGMPLTRRAGQSCETASARIGRAMQTEEKPWPTWRT